MRIATWNLDRCRVGPYARAANLSALIAGLDADVWVLTETYRDFAPGPEYRLIAHSAAAPDRDAARGECWVALWSRLPAEPVPLSADPERVAAARVGRTTVIGIVLPWLSDHRYADLSGEAGFRARLAEQVADWRRLRAGLGGLCVTGDFNQDLLSVGHYYGSAGGRAALRAALAEAGLDCLTGGADDPLAGSPGLACIDHICVGGLRAVGSPCSSAYPRPGELPCGLTDHYCTWADVEEADPGDAATRGSATSR